MKSLRYTLVSAALLLVAEAAGQGRVVQDSRERPNIVFVLTDDQRYDVVDFMPRVAERFLKHGAVFRNAFISNPICCPSRASILSGGYYSHNTGVLTNQQPNGSFGKFRDASTLATALQASGYRTALLGKYLNGYLASSAYIPPGWSRFWGAENLQNWYDWEVVYGSSTPTASGSGRSMQVSENAHDFLRDRALELIDEAAHEQQPFFLMFSTFAPHQPATPAQEARDDEVYARFLTGGNFAYRGRGWGRGPLPDLDDKPLYLRMDLPNWWDGDPRFYDDVRFLQNHRTPDDFVGRQIQSMLMVDRAVESIIRRIEQQGLLDKTVFIFASDNGYLWGEHTQYGKGYAYEESARTPLLIWHVGIDHRYIDALVQVDLDVPNTILDYAGIPPFPGTDGRSLRPLLRAEDPPNRWRKHLFFEFYDFGAAEPQVPGDPPRRGAKIVPGWVSVRDQQYKFVEYRTLEHELYDLQSDPFELKNLADDAQYADLVEHYARVLERKRGLAIMTPLSDFPDGEPRLATARRGDAYSFPLRAVGGVGPYRWMLDRVDFRLGLRIKRATGELFGTITGAPGEYTVDVRVEDSSVSPQHGGNQVHVRRFNLRVSR